MNWNDAFSGFYDRSLEKLYYDSRVRAVELLDLQPDHLVLDLACGTGSNFPHVLPRIPEGRLLGLDYSAGMLRKAAGRSEAQGWTNVHLVQADVRTLDVAALGGVDRILCVLGFSVFPEWERVLEGLFAALIPGGKMVIVDVYSTKNTWHRWLVERLAQADISRPVWEPLERLSVRFHREVLPVPQHKVGGELWVAVGEKES